MRDERWRCCTANAETNVIILDDDDDDNLVDPRKLMIICTIQNCWYGGNRMAISLNRVCLGVVVVVHSVQSANGAFHRFQDSDIFTPYRYISVSSSKLDQDQPTRVNTNEDRSVACRSASNP